IIRNQRIGALRAIPALLACRGRTDRHENDRGHQTFCAQRQKKRSEIIKQVFGSASAHIGEIGIAWHDDDGARRAGTTDARPITGTGAMSSASVVQRRTSRPPTKSTAFSGGGFDTSRRSKSAISPSQ